MTGPIETDSVAARTPTATPERDASMSALDPRVATLWRLQRLTRLVLVGLPVSIGGALLLAPRIGTGWAAGMAGLVLAWQAGMAILWPGLEYRAFRYAVRDNDLLVRHGVIFRRWSAIPFNRIQHADTRQGPIERLLGLARLVVYTASGAGADGGIPGLPQEEAERLRDTLSRRGGDDGV